MLSAQSSSMMVLWLLFVHLAPFEAIMVLHSNWTESIGAPSHLGEPSAAPGADAAGMVGQGSGLDAALARMITDSSDLVLDRVGDRVESERFTSLNCQSSAWVGPDLTSPKLQKALGVWRSLQNQATTPSVIKPAFLMMIYQTIVFPKAWESLFRSAGSGSSLLLIHAKMPNFIVPDFFKPYMMQEEVLTERCHDAVLMLRMMALALRDQAVTHMAIVSGDTLPIRPLNAIRYDLAQDSRSRFCADAAWSRAETWFVMRRDQAALMTEHLVELRNLIPYSDCEDEDMFYWPLMARQEDVKNQCMMMTDWSLTNKAWIQNAIDCKCDEFLLLSKKDPATCSRPSLFRDVASRGLDSLMASPMGYWFVRKFPGDGVLGTATVDGFRSLDEEMALRLAAASRTTMNFFQDSLTLNQLKVKNKSHF